MSWNARLLGTARPDRLGCGESGKHEDRYGIGTECRGVGRWAREALPRPAFPHSYFGASGTLSHTVEIVIDPSSKVLRCPDKTLWHLHGALSSNAQPPSRQPPQPAPKPPQSRKGVLTIYAHSKPLSLKPLQLSNQYAFNVLTCIWLLKRCVCKAKVNGPATFWRREVRNVGTGGRKTKEGGKRG